MLISKLYHCFFKLVNGFRLLLMLSHCFLVGQRFSAVQASPASASFYCTPATKASWSKGPRWQSSEHERAFTGQVEKQLPLKLFKRLEKAYEMLNELDEDGMG